MYRQPGGVAPMSRQGYGSLALGVPTGALAAASRRSEPATFGEVAGLARALLGITADLRPLHALSRGWNPALGCGRLRVTRCTRLWGHEAP